LKAAVPKLKIIIIIIIIISALSGGRFTWERTPVLLV